MEAEVKNKPIKILVEVHHLDGTKTFEWREVPGTEISLEGVTLKNGETLTLDYTERS